MYAYVEIMSLKLKVSEAREWDGHACQMIWSMRVKSVLTRQMNLFILHHNVRIQQGFVSRPESGPHQTLAQGVTLPVVSHLDHKVVQLLWCLIF